MLPPRVPLPYGKPLTVIINTKVLFNDHGRRPGMDRLLGTIIAQYEIILYADKSTDFEEVDMTEQLSSYRIAPDMYPDFPGWQWKNPRVLNRPLDSTIIVESCAEEAYFAPENSLVLGEWNGQNVHDTKLAQLAELLDLIAKKVIVNKLPIVDVIPDYQSPWHDCIETWRYGFKRFKIPRPEELGP